MTVFFHFERYKLQNYALDLYTETHGATLTSSVSYLPETEMCFTEGKEEDIEAFRKVLAEHKIPHIENTTPRLNWDNPFARGWISPTDPK